MMLTGIRSVILLALCTCVLLPGVRGIGAPSPPTFRTGDIVALSGGDVWTYDAATGYAPHRLTSTKGMSGLSVSSAGIACLTNSGSVMTIRSGEAPHQIQAGGTFGGSTLWMTPSVILTGSSIPGSGADDGIWRLSVDGSSAPRLVVPPADSDFVVFEAPVPSPGGQRIAYTMAASGHSLVWSLNTSNWGNKEFFGPNGLACLTDIAWLNDHTMLVSYSPDTDFPDEYRHGGIWAMDIKTGAQTLWKYSASTAVDAMCPSANGTWLAVALKSSSTLINIATGATTPLKLPDNSNVHAVSDDGKQIIAFQSGPVLADGSVKVNGYVVDVASGTATFFASDVTDALWCK